MWITIGLKILIGFFPVLLFLLALVFMDSYKLVRMKALLPAIAGGAAAAGLSLLLNSGLIGFFQGDFAFYSRYVAPLVEESLKAAVLVYFFRTNRVGFLVDAAILGFAAGAGFSIVENMHFLKAAVGADIVVWAVRGLGTAMMHGGTTAVFAFLTKALSDRRTKNHPWPAAVPGLALAFTVHSAFNHFLLPPVAAAAVMMAVLPLVAVNVFIAGERSTRKWLEIGFDTDVELLGLINAGRFSTSKIGRYVLSLKDRFSGEVMADLFCLIRIHLELSIGAKGILLMREAGLPVVQNPGFREKFRELEYLQKSVGPTGMMAVSPILHRSRRDLWGLHMLGGQ
ncbi:MAG: PrsW family intramembrane metalloprotease [Candidatus Aminicenantes bacterium]|nr:PrsW family intramembrane metalloprotease [Candidatus Aminicenantes bacterium]